MGSNLALTDTAGIIHLAKVGCNISCDNKDLTDKQIGDICKFVAQYAPDNECVDGKIKYGEIGIELMLSIALYVFPRFYQRHELWQRN